MTLGVFVGSRGRDLGPQGRQSGLHGPFRSLPSRFEDAPYDTSVVLHRRFVA